MNKSILVLIATLAVCFSLKASGINYIELDTGYRYDRLDETLDEFIASPGVPNTYFSQLQKFHDISSYQLGARGMWTFPCSSFVVTGSGHYGWIQSGDFSQDDTNRARIKGHTGDVSAGVGYLMPVCNCFEFIPLIGFSYDHLKFDVDHFTSSHVDIFGPLPSSVDWTTSFYGPWIGFNVLTSRCVCLPLTFDVGYAFHYGWAKKRFDVDPLIVGLWVPYHNARLTNMKGHEFHIEGRYQIWCAWFLGVRLNYTSWTNSNVKRDVVNSTDVLPPPDTYNQFTRNFSWQSFATTVTVGTCF